MAPVWSTFRLVYVRIKPYSKFAHIALKVSVLSNTHPARLSNRLHEYTEGRNTAAFRNVISNSMSLKYCITVALNCLLYEHPFRNEYMRTFAHLVSCSYITKRKLECNISSFLARSASHGFLVTPLTHEITRGVVRPLTGPWPLICILLLTEEPVVTAPLKRRTDPPRV